MHNIAESSIFAPTLNNETIGFLAQLVEQWIENPCVPGSIPGETTGNYLISNKSLKLYNLRDYFLDIYQIRKILSN